MAVVVEEEELGVVDFFLFLFSFLSERETSKKQAERKRNTAASRHLTHLFSPAPPLSIHENVNSINREKEERSALEEELKRLRG